MDSAFQQHIRGGRGSFDIGRSFARYRNRLARLEILLGREHIEYWLYDPGRFPEGCVVRDFCARLGIDFAPAKVVRSNDSLSLPALRLLYAYRKFGPGYGSGREAVRENFALQRALALLPGPRLRLHGDLVAPVLERHVDQIRWIEERLGASLDEPPNRAPDAVRDESDLLRFEPLELDWLAAQVPGRWRESDPDPAAVARVMHRLRKRLLPWRPLRRVKRVLATLIRPLRRPE